MRAIAWIWSLSISAHKIGSTDAGWSSSVARWAHNPEVVGSNPAPATNFYLIRKLFTTTNSEEIDIAPAAYIGAKFPLAATGMQTMLYKNAQTKLDLIIFVVFFEILIASRAAFRDGLIKVISAAAIAVSVPDPMAILKSDLAMAAASLMPSPIIKTLPFS